MTSLLATHTCGVPIITSMRVVPLAGRDGMLLNLSGAHAPFFTRNLVVLTDTAGNQGVRARRRATCMRC